MLSQDGELTSSRRPAHAREAEYVPLRTSLSSSARIRFTWRRPEEGGGRGPWMSNSVEDGGWRRRGRLARQRTTGVPYATYYPSIETTRRGARCMRRDKRLIFKLR